MTKTMEIENNNHENEPPKRDVTKSGISSKPNDKTNDTNKKHQKTNNNKNKNITHFLNNSQSNSNKTTISNPYKSNKSSAGKKTKVTTSSSIDTTSTNTTTAETITIEDDDATMTSDATPARNNYPDDYKTRVTFKMNISIENNSTKPQQVVLQTLATLLQHAKNHDKHIAFLPWSKVHATRKPLTLVNHIPTNLYNFSKIYSPKLNPKKDQRNQQIYASLFLQHSLPLKELIQELKPWLDKDDHNIYECDLQVEKTLELGWFLYSTSKMDKDILAQDIYDVCKVHCAVKWKMIANGKKGPVDRKKQIRAMHLVVDKEGGIAHLDTFSSHFGKRDNGFPKNRKLRFFPHRELVRSSTVYGKLKVAAEVQKNLTDLALFGTSDEITALDTVHQPKNPKDVQQGTKAGKKEKCKCLRELIGGIQSSTKGTKDKPVALFINADETFFEDGVQLEFVSNVEEEARIMIRNLIPYLRGTVGKYVEHYFTKEAVARSKNYCWDKATKTVICASDENTTMVLEDDIFGLKAALQDKNAGESLTSTNTNRPDPTSPTSNTTDKVQSPSNRLILNLQEDDESSRGSISTLDTKEYLGAGDKVGLHPNTNITTSNHPDDDASVISAMTLEEQSYKTANLALSKEVALLKAQNDEDKKVGETKRQEKEAEVDALSSKVMRLEEALSQMQKMLGKGDNSTLLEQKQSPSKRGLSMDCCG